MQSTTSPAPALAGPTPDTILLELARHAHATFAGAARQALDACVRATGAREASVWLVSDDGAALTCAGLVRAGDDAFHQGATVSGAWPGASALRDRRWGTDVLPRLAAEGGEGATALDAGVWAGGALAGFVRLEREAAAAWTEAEGAFAASVADRLGAALEREARARAEEQVRERARYVNDLEAAARLGSWDQDLVTDAIVWSAQQCRLHGIEPGTGATNGPEFQAFLHPDDRARVMEYCAHAIERRESLDAEYRVVWPDGTVRWLHAEGRAIRDADDRPVRLVGTSRDITDRVMADHALRASEARFRDLFEQFPLSVQILSPEARTLKVNAAFTRLWGWRAEELSAWNPLEDTRLESLRDDLRRGFAGEPVHMPPVLLQGRGRGPHADGEATWPRWIQASVFPVRGPDGALREVILVHQDVTEARQMLDALREREHQLAQTQQMVQLGNWRWTVATGHVTWSDELYRIYGLSPDTHVPSFEAYMERVHPDDRERVHEELTIALAQAEPFDFEERIVRPDGEVRVLRSVGEPVLGADGSVVGLLGACQDVTARRAAEDALRASEESYRAIFENSNDAIYVQDAETGAVLDANRKACAWHGVTPDEMRARGLEFITNGPAPYTRERLMDEARRAGHGGEGIITSEWRASNARTGEQIWGEVSLQRVTIRGQERILALVRDIRDRKRAEQALRASEENYRTIFQNAGAAIWLHDVDTGAFVDVNDTACAMFGYTAEEMKARGVEGMTTITPPHTPEKAHEYMTRAAAGEPQTFEWPGRHRDGGVVWVEVTLRRVSILGEDLLLATGRDITDRKRAEEAVRASEENYRIIFQHSGDAIWVHDVETGATLDVNDAACELFGYSAEEQRSLPHAILLYPGSEFTGERVAEYMALAAAGDTPRFEWMGRHRDGHPVWGEITLRRVTIGGEDRILATVRDIADRKQAEEALRRAKEELERRVDERTAELHAANEALEEEVAEHEAAKEALLERTQEMEGLFRALPDLFFRLGADGTFLDFRAGATMGLMLPAEQFLWRRMHDVMPPDVAGAVDVAMLRARESGQMASVDYTLPAQDRVRDFEARVVPLPDGTFVAVVRDVTERKDAERALLEREEHFRRLIENAHDMVVIVDGAGCGVYASPSVERVLGWTPEEICGPAGSELVHPDDLPCLTSEVRSMPDTPGAVVHLEYRYRHKDGAWRQVEAFGTRIDPANPAAGLILNVRDVTDRKTAERALRESEEHYRALIENSSDVATINDAVTGAVLYASPAAERVLGWTPDEMLGRTSGDFVHPDDQPSLAEQMQLLLLDPSAPQTMHYRFRRKDGEWMVLETTARLMTDGAELRMVANARDVTDRAAAQEALRRNEEHFRALIENAQDIVLILKADGTMTYLSPPIARILGWTPEELTGKNAFLYMHQEDQAAVAGELARVLAEPGLTGQAEYRFQDSRGRWRHLEAFGRRLDGPDGPGIVANVRDVTERHQAAEALRKSEEHFRALTENASDLITVLDARGAYLYQSPSIMRVMGYTPADLLGATPFPYMHPDDVEMARAALGRMATEPGVSHTVQFRFRHADGSWRVLEAIGRTLLPDSADEGVVVISRDVTERRAAEEALRQATEAAERANRAKSEFLSRMSHELRTPMNSILGFAQLLARVELAAEQQKSVQHILKAGRHLLNLINEVLEIARIESGRHNLSLEPVRVGPLLDEALGLVRPLAAQWGVSLESAGCPPDAFVRADRQRLAQVLLNLLSNAIKYNRPGGRVRIACLPEGDGFAVRVEDTGSGIPAEKADQLFTPFARLGAESTGVEGTGLGLALSQRLTEAMGGELALESTGVEGSVFRLSLAGAADPLDALEGTEASAGRDGAIGTGEASLLYIEDNLANLSLVETILLSRPGWRTLPALQGQIGVELARQHRPDLILLDLHLPDIPGEEVLRRLRADGRTAGIPVIVISADATRATAERLRALGADAYLSKPIDVDEFLETVERYLARGDDQ